MKDILDVINQIVQGKIEEDTDSEAVSESPVAAGKNSVKTHLGVDLNLASKGLEAWEKMVEQVEDNLDNIYSQSRKTGSSTVELPAEYISALRLFLGLLNVEIGVQLGKIRRAGSGYPGPMGPAGKKK